MEIKIVAQHPNPLLKRTEYRFEVGHSAQSTPSREAIRSELAKDLKVPKERIVVEAMHSKFGTPKTVGEAMVYTSTDDAKAIVREHILLRNHLIEKEVAPEATPAEAPATPAAPAAAPTTPAPPAKEVTEKPGAPATKESPAKPEAGTKKEAHEKKSAPAPPAKGAAEKPGAPATEESPAKPEASAKKETPAKKPPAAPTKKEG